MDVLAQIKRLVLQGRYELTAKASIEMSFDGLATQQVIASIINATTISKTMRSRSIQRRQAGEKLYVIKATSYNGTLIYSKRTIRQEAWGEASYVIISAKESA